MSQCRPAIRANHLPDITFYRLLRTAPQPVRAARDAMGHLPKRATQYCEATAAASSYGWWLFPPMEFSLLWDGRRILWTWGGRTDWLLLDAAQFPGYAAEFDATAPQSLRGYSPPFLTALPESGLVQIWTGFFARSAPGWSLLIRPPANIASAGDVLAYEGIVEADVWFGPVFANLRLSRRNEPVRLSPAHPLLQVQPVPRLAYSDAAQDSMSLVPGLEDLTSADWSDFATTIVERSDSPPDSAGSYAVAARRRRKRECPMASAAWPA
jgi:hypothetical protein